MNKQHKEKAMFNDKQIKSLESELESSRVKTREKGNISLSYLEGFDLIETANNVFGFGNWSYSVSRLESVSHEQNQNQNQVICYKAVVQITVHNENHSQSIQREDVGFGTGIAKTQADAHENGAKESITDGLKRCLRSFGNQFGNSLYDKSRNKNSTNTVQTNNTNVPVQNQTSNHNVHQQQTHSNQATQNQQHQIQSQYDPYEYQSLYNLGLEVNEHNGFLLVSGNDIFSKKDSIKACGFRWDGKTKQWYKQLEEGAA